MEYDWTMTKGDWEASRAWLSACDGNIELHTFSGAPLGQQLIIANLISKSINLVEIMVEFGRNRIEETDK